MSELHMGTAEARFADIVWENAPCASGVLVRLAAEAFDWKKTTTYTVLKRLCDRGIFRNENGTVSAVISRDDYYARHSEQYVEETFGGSLPAFFAAFTKRKNISPEELAQIRRLIDSYEEE